MTIICISGKAQHGKDTTAQFMKEAMEASGKKVLIAHYGDLLKYICKTFFGWDGQKNEAGRGLLQRVGTDVIRRQDEDFWVRFIGNILQLFYAEWDVVILPDCRFRNELRILDFMRRVNDPRNLASVHLRVIRPDFDNGLTEEQKAHPSETELDNVMPNAWIWNDGDLDDLKTEVQRWVACFLITQELAEATI